MFDDTVGNFLYDLKEGKHDQVLAQFNRRGDEVERVTLHGFEEDTGRDLEKGQRLFVTLDFFEAHPDDKAKARGTLRVVWTWERWWFDDRPNGMEGDVVTYGNTWREEEIPEEERLVVEVVADNQVTHHPASFLFRDVDELEPAPYLGPMYRPSLAPNYNVSDSLPF